jgi:hypothetical protein
MHNRSFVAAIFGSLEREKKKLAVRSLVRHWAGQKPVNRESSVLFLRGLPTLPHQLLSLPFSSSPASFIIIYYL